MIAWLPPPAIWMLRPALSQGVRASASISLPEVSAGALRGPTVRGIIGSVVEFAPFASGTSPARGEGGIPMKKGIHPNYKQTMVTCACGETFMTGSTRENIRVEICSKCHPFYTGQRKYVDSEGRVQKFAKKYGIQV